MTAHLPWSASGFSLPLWIGPSHLTVFPAENSFLVILAHSWWSLMTLTETHPVQWWLFIAKIIGVRLWLRDLLSQCVYVRCTLVTLRSVISFGTLWTYIVRSEDSVVWQWKSGRGYWGHLNNFECRVWKSWAKPMPSNSESRSQSTILDLISCSGCFPFWGVI